MRTSAGHHCRAQVIIPKVRTETTIKNNDAIKWTLNLPLSDEIRAFIDERSGPGTPYPTPGDYVRSLLENKKAEIDAANLRQSIIAAYKEFARRDKSA